MKKLYIYGAGGHAKVVAETAELCGFTVCGFFEDGDERVGDLFFGKPIVSLKDIPEYSFVFVAFGNNVIRLQKGIELKKRFSIPSIIHPFAQVSKQTEIGDGVFIGALSNIDPGCHIDDFCIINNHASISHDSIIKKGTHISVSAALAGHVTIGSCCFVGIGSVIKDEITIGDYSTIGAGAVVISNIPGNVTAVGCPTRIINHKNK